MLSILQYVCVCVCAKVFVTSRMKVAAKRLRIVIKAGVWHAQQQQQQQHNGPFNSHTKQPFSFANNYNKHIKLQIHYQSLN